MLLNKIGISYKISNNKIINGNIKEKYLFLIKFMKIFNINARIFYCK